MLANFIAVGAITPGLFGVGITVATDRACGLLERKRALPMKPRVILAAKFVTSMVFAATVSIVLIMLAPAVEKIGLEVVQWAGRLILALFGVAPVGGLGLLVGTLVKGQAAPAMLDLLHAPMSWVPVSMLPYSLEQLTKLAQYVVGENGPDLRARVLVLVGMAGLFFGLARRALAKVR